MRRKFIPSSSRRKARSISPEKIKLMTEYFPTIKADINNIDELNKKIASFKYCNLEIGFGGGEHLIHQALNNPDTLFIGSEVFYNGLCSCIYKIHKANIKNILICDGDVRLLLEVLKEKTLDKIFVLFPDPWPKNKHEKKRLINKQTLDLIFPLLKENGIMRIATDHNVYFDHVLKIMGDEKRFKLKATYGCHSEAQSAEESLEIFRYAQDDDYPKDHIITKYQQKAVEAGRVSRFLEYSL